MWMGLAVLHFKVQAQVSGRLGHEKIQKTRRGVSVFGATSAHHNFRYPFLLFHCFCITRALTRI